MVAADWERPTICSEWSISDIVAHLASGAEVRWLTIQRGLRGDTSPLFKNANGRATMMQAKQVLVGDALLIEYRQAINALINLIEPLTPSEMNLVAWDQTGIHEIPWFVHQRLGETVLHGGDIHEALGERAVYTKATLEILLPQYTQQLPRLHQSQGQGMEASIELRATDLDWQARINIALGKAEVVDSNAASAPSCVVEGPSGDLLRLITGRANAEQLLDRDGALHIRRNQELMRNWRKLFRPL